MARRAMAKRKFYRCKSCHSPVPEGYLRCGVCGNDHGIIVVNTMEELQREYSRAIAARAGTETSQ